MKSPLFTMEHIVVLIIHCMESIKDIIMIQYRAYQSYSAPPGWLNRQTLHSCKLQEFADDNFKLDENGRKFAKKVGNTVGKGEIARYEQFLLSHIVFKRIVLQTCKNQALFGKGLTLFLERNYIRLASVAIHFIELVLLVVRKKPATYI